MKIADHFKKYKLLHWFYNLTHLFQLKHNQEPYSKYGVKKPLFGSVSSKDFPDKTSQIGRAHV